MIIKEASKKIIRSIGIYGAIIGALPPIVISILSLINVELVFGNISIGEFRNIYYLRMVVALFTGAIVGGFASAFATKTGISLIKKMKLWKGLLMGLFLGAIVGFLTAGSTPLVLLISSTDVTWAIGLIKRAAIAGTFVGAFAGAIAGIIGVIYFTEKERKNLLKRK